MRGGDPEQTWARIAKDIKEMTDAGIPSAFVNDLYLRRPDVIESLQEAGLLTNNEVQNGVIRQSRAESNPETIPPGKPEQSG